MTKTPAFIMPPPYGSGVAFNSSGNTISITPVESKTQLVQKYNALVAQATAAGLAGYRELRFFADKPTALARITALEGALRARAEGLRAADATTEPEEIDVVKKTKVKMKKAAKAPKTAAAKGKTAAPKTAVVKAKAAASKANGHAVRAGSKTEIIRGLLTRKGGCTSREVLDATGWPAVSMPAMAKACGLSLRKEKEKGSGSVTQYFGE